MFPLIKYWCIAYFFCAVGFSQSNSIKLGIPIGNSDSVEYLQFSPNGKLLLTSASDKKFMLWDVITGRLLYVLPVEIDFFNELGSNLVQFSPDGNHILSHANGKVQFWDVKTGKPIKTIDNVSYATLSPINQSDKDGGDYLLAIKSGLENTFLLLETKSNKIIHEITGSSEEINTVKFSQLGNYMVADTETYSFIYEAASGKELFKIERVIDLNFSPDDKKIILNKGRDVKVIDATTGKVLFEKSSTSYEDLHISQDGKYVSYFENENFITKSTETGSLLSSFTIENGGSYKSSNLEHPVFITTSVGAIEIYDVLTGTLVNKIDMTSYNLNKGYPDIYETAFSYNGKLLAFSIFKDVRVFVADMSTNRISEILEGNLDTTKVLFTNNNDRHFATIPWNSGVVNLWDANKASLITKFDTQMDYLSGTQFSAMGIYTATNSMSLSNDIELPNVTKLWETATGKELVSANSRCYELSECFKFNPNKLYEDFVLFTELEPNGNPKLKLLNIKKGTALEINADAIAFFEFSPNGEYFAAAFNTGEFKVWGLTTTRLITTIQASDNIFNFSFSPNNDVVLTYAENNPIKLWDFKSGNLIRELDTANDLVGFVKFSPDGNYIVTNTDKNSAKIWEAKTGKLLSRLEHFNPESSTFDVYFSKNSNYMVTITNYAEATLWDLKNGKLLFELKDFYIDHFAAYLFGMVFPSASFTDDEKHVLVSYKDGTVAISTQTGKLFHKFQGEFVSFIDNGKTIVTESREGGVIFWDFYSGKKLFQQFVFSGQPLWLLPNGYYASSKEAASGLYYVDGLQTIGFEQLDVKYNRPDKVLEALGKIGNKKDTTMIKAYKNAWLKRIKKLQVDTISFQADFSVPKSDFINRDKIEVESKSSQLQLHINARDSIFLLDRFNVWINEVPIYGRNGLSLKRRQMRSLDTIINITLSKGLNKIETSALNVNGIESYRLPLYVNHSPQETSKETLYFVGIGVDKYLENGHDLNYSVKDIKDLAVQLKEKYGTQIKIDTLFNQNVTIKNILKLKEQLETSKVDDKVIISFSGHGLLSQDLDYYLAMYDVDFNSPEQKGLPYENLEYLLDGIPARKKLLFIDACHSGELDKDEVKAISTAAIENEGLKGSISVESKQTTVGMKNSFELMKELFNNIDRATGATVISAAAGTQFAQERGDLKNGVFTYCILDQLKSKETITVSELKQIVSKQVQELTNGLQQPTSRNETIENNWNVW